MSNHKIAVVGLGYVGLPLAIELSKKYHTIGFDNNPSRIQELVTGNDKTGEISENDLISSKLIFSADYDSIKDSNVYIITVPTPIDKYNNPNVKPLEQASSLVGKMLLKNNIVIFESTVYPGATEELCVPILEKESNLKYNKDFFCGYSPERINPGDEKHSLKSIVKVTSGSNSATAKTVDEIYKSIIAAGTHMAPSMKVAEAAKVIENIQRDVNIALINELSMLFNEMDINTNDVLKAASTKWNFLPFKPGLVGGHCIGVDPFYLTHKASEIGFNAEMILAGRRINDKMGRYIAQKAILEMSKNKINITNATVGVLGLTFKENCPDLRNSKVIDVITHLKQYGCKIKVNDCVANHSDVLKEFQISLAELDEITNIDCLILAVPHDQYKKVSKKEFGKIIKSNSVILDIKGVFKDKFYEIKNLRYRQL